MKKLLLISLTLLLSQTVQADLVKEGAALCSKIKSCAVSEIDQQQISPDEKEAILNLFDTQCVESVKKYEKDVGAAGLEGKAHACLDSLQAQTCETLTQGTGPITTPSCTDFENSAKAAGIDIGQ